MSIRDELEAFIVAHHADWISEAIVDSGDGGTDCATGFCVHCEAEIEDVEPLAEWERCPECHADAVFSARELWFRHAVKLAPVPDVFTS